MARSLSQILIRTSRPTLFATKSPATHASHLLTLRGLSSQSENSQLVGPNLVYSDSEEREALAVQRIEDAIHCIIVKRSAPDWLPFLPGSSYWVPPRRRSYGIAELLQSLENTATGEEAISLTNVSGWSSFDFLINGPSQYPPEVETPSNNMYQSEDEEG